MRTRSPLGLSDAALTHELGRAFSAEDGAAAITLTYLAEFDARRLYLGAGYSSMLAYCTQRLGRSEDAALKRIRAARAARLFPVIFDRVATGRLSLSAVVMLKPHLTPENAGGLLAAAEGQPKAALERWLAERFPRTEELPLVEAVPAHSDHPHDEVAPGPPQGLGARGSMETTPEQVAPGPPRARVEPIAPQRFTLRITIDQATHEKLVQVQELMSEMVPAGDLATLFRLGLEALAAKAQKRKWAATTRPHPAKRTNRNPRHIPAHVRRAVWIRDGGQCSFVSAEGHRCTERRFIQFDHVTPVACGGQPTVSEVRLLCAPHNRHEAERVFGAGFIAGKRAEASRAKEAKARARAAARDQAEAKERAEAEARAQAVAAREITEDVLRALRSLGFRANQARRGAEHATTLPFETTLEERLRVALRLLCPPHLRPRTPAPT